MALQTTRIDTLYSPVPLSHGESHVRNVHHQPEDVLLVDFVPSNSNGANSNVGNSNVPSSTSSSASISIGPSRFHNHNGYQLQQLPLSNHTSIHNIQNSQNSQNGHTPHNNNNVAHLHNNNINNDLSHYTLVNLSNQPEPGDELEEDEGESQVFFNDHNHIPLKRAVVPGGAISSAKANVKVSSSMSSSSTDDSDTGFLVPSNKNNGIRGSRSLGKDKQYKLQSSVPPSTSYPGSPGFNAVQQSQSHRKRLRRRRSSGRRQPHNQPTKDESGDFISLCCCFGDDEHHNRPNRSGHNPNASGSSNSLSKVASATIIIIVVIALATFASIIVSLQRKVDTLSWEVKKYSNPTTATSDQPSPESLSTVQSLVAKQNQLNISYSLLKTALDELNQRVINLEKQTKGLPPLVEEVRKDLATLGSELEGSINEMKKEMQDFKNANPNDKPKGEEVNNGESNSEIVGTIATTLSSSGGGP